MSQDTDSLGAAVAASFADWRPEALVDGAARSRLQAAAAPYPAALSSLFGYECRLGTAEPEADLLVCVGRRPGEAAALGALAERHGESGIWPRLGRLAALLQHEAAPIHNCWLEFDLVGAAAVVPSVFFGSRVLTTAPAATGGGLPPERRWLAGTLALLRGEPALAPALEARIAAVLAALPEGGLVFQVGAMTSRAGAPVRLCVRGIPLAGLPAFLRAAGWPGEAGRALARLAPLVDEVRLGLDLDEAGIGPRLGLECYLAADARSGARWIGLARALVEAGLCREDKARALLAWPGITHERRHAAIWPPSLRATTRGEGNLFRRWVHHVKLTLEPGGPPTAKAYLAAENATVPDAALRAAIAAAEAAGGA